MSTLGLRTGPGHKCSLDSLEDRFPNLYERLRKRSEENLDNVEENLASESESEDCDLDDDSIEGLRAQLRHLQMHSENNQAVLRDAAMDGQQLLHEEFQLQTRLSHLHHELNMGDLRDTDAFPLDNKRSSTLSDDHGYDDRAARRDPSYGKSAAAKRTHQKILHDAAEVERLRESNGLIMDEITEKEIALTKKLAEPKGRLADGDDGLGQVSEAVRQELHEMHTKFQRAEDGARRSQILRERELEDLERAVIETRRHSISTRAIMTESLEASARRHSELQEELACLSEARVESSTPLLDSIERLRKELQDGKERRENADADLRVVQIEVEAAHRQELQYEAQRKEELREVQEQHVEELEEAQERAEQLRLQELTAELVQGKHRAAQCVTGTHQPTPPSTVGDISEGESEVWGSGAGDTLSQAGTEPDMDRSGTSGLPSMTKAATRRRQKRGLKNVYKDINVVVHTADAECEPDVPEKTHTPKKGNRHWAAAGAISAVSDGFEAVSAAAPTAAETAAAASAAASAAAAAASAVFVAAGVGGSSAETHGDAGRSNERTWTAWAMGSSGTKDGGSAGNDDTGNSDPRTWAAWATGSDVKDGGNGDDEGAGNSDARTWTAWATGGNSGNDGGGDDASKGTTACEDGSASNDGARGWAGWGAGLMGDAMSKISGPADDETTTKPRGRRHRRL